MMPDPDSSSAAAGALPDLPAPSASASAPSLLHVFVYGTLRAGGSNDIQRHRPPPRWVGRALVTGTLYDFGGWPGLRLQGSTAVAGEVWAIDACIEPLLDRLEGVRADGTGEYVKRWTSLPIDDRAIECLLYEINDDRWQGRPLIAGGDWIAHVAAHSADTQACGASKKS